MEITVFGASGRTGREIVRQALDTGRRVTAVVRDPARLPVTHPGLQVVTAPEVTDPEALVPALTGRDAAISALGPSSIREDGIVAAATRAVVQAMEQTQVRRLLVISATPVGPLPRSVAVRQRVLTPVLRVVMKKVYADLAEMERDLHSAAVEWTVFRPPRLIDRPRTTRYRTETGGNVPGGTRISRADLAHAMLTALDDPGTVKQTVGVAY